MKHAFYLLAISALIGCGTAQHAVKVEDEQAFKSDTKIVVGEVSNKTGESFDIDIEALFEDALVKELENQALLGQKDDTGAITMNASIIEYTKGDAFKRWLMPGYGSTKLVVECQLLDSEGNVDAVAQANRSVDFGGGYTAGAWKKIFDDVAVDLVSELSSRIKP